MNQVKSGEPSERRLQHLTVCESISCLGDSLWWGICWCIFGIHIRLYVVLLFRRATVCKSNTSTPFDPNDSPLSTTVFSLLVKFFSSIFSHYVNQNFYQTDSLLSAQQHRFKQSVLPIWQKCEFCALSLLIWLVRRHKKKKNVPRVCRKTQKYRTRHCFFLQMRLRSLFCKI